MAEARRAAVEMTYNGISAAQMSEYIRSFSYSDVASGASDSIKLELSDRDRHWIGGWFPQMGDRLTPVIVRHNWDVDGDRSEFKCGTFVIDDFSFEGDPLRCTIDALAIPSISGFKTTERTYTYEKTTLREIGASVAKRAGMELYYEADSVSVESVAQDNQSDCAFYNDLVKRYGLALKIYNDRIVVFDEAVYEQKPPVLTLTESDIEPSWQWNTTLQGTYTGVDYQYTHTEKDKTFSYRTGGGSRILTCNEAANNQTEAEIIALAALNNANKNTTTMKATLRMPARIIATDCVIISGLGQLDGRYYVEQADTTVSDGTKTSLSLRRVEYRFVREKPQEQRTKTSGTAAEKAAQTEVLKRGDIVRIRQGAKTWYGRPLHPVSYTTRYHVLQVGGWHAPDDFVMVIGWGGFMLPMRAADLYKDRS